MGGWIDRMRWGGDPDEVHPMSGLSRRDIHAVQSTWALVYADSVGNGTELLKRLFRAHPETKEYFKMIRKLKEDEYITNMQFKAHVINLMTSINLAVTNLHQPEVVAAMMQKIGEAHNRRMLKEKHFMDLKGVIANMFVEVLGLNDATMTSWSKTVDFWYIHIFPKLEK